MSVSMNSYACSEGFQSGQPNLLALPHITVADWQKLLPRTCCTLKQESMGGPAGRRDHL